MSIKNGKTKKKKSKGSKKLMKVSFDDEVITKKQAEQILSRKKCIQLNSKSPEIHTELNDKETTSNLVNTKKKKRKNKKFKTESTTELTSKQLESSIEPKQELTEGLGPKKTKPKKNKLKTESTVDENIKILETSEKIEDSNIEDKEKSTESSNPKKRKQKLAAEELTENNTEDSNDTSSNKPKPLSIRAQKRLKHAKLLEEKKLKSELGLQEKCLNYLSKWKHAFNEWKFEKLRQIWLQQNLFDRNKIPDEFWDTVIDYMKNASGQVREILCKEALKIIENENNDDQEDYKYRLKRARDIIQHLKE